MIWNDVFPFRELDLLANRAELHEVSAETCDFDFLVHAAWRPRPDSSLWPAIGIAERYGCGVVGVPVLPGVLESASPAEQHGGPTHDGGGRFLQSLHYPAVDSRFARPVLQPAGQRVVSVPEVLIESLRVEWWY